MSDSAEPGLQASTAADEGPSAGTLLRQAREAAGLHVATLAANLKVPVRKLEALEEDRYDLLPDAVFVRALASSVCRTLKVDARPVLARLPQTSQPRLAPASRPINAPFRAPGDARHAGWLALLSRPAVLTVVALLLGALVIVLLPVAQRDGGIALSTGSAAGEAAQPLAGGTEALMPPPGATAAVPMAEAPVESVPPAPSPGASPQPGADGLPGATAPGAPATSAPMPTATPAAPAAVGSTSSSTSSSAAATAVAGSAGAGSPATASAASGIVVFRTSGPSWVEVTDASGKTLLRRLLGAGEIAAASGALPLAVTVGSVAQTEVQVRGQPFDLAAVARDNVARFQVK